MEVFHHPTHVQTRHSSPHVTPHVLPAQLGSAGAGSPMGRRLRHQGAKAPAMALPMVTGIRFNLKMSSQLSGAPGFQRCPRTPRSRVEERAVVGRGQSQAHGVGGSSEKEPSTSVIPDVSSKNHRSSMKMADRALGEGTIDLRGPAWVAHPATNCRTIAWTNPRPARKTQNNAGGPGSPPSRTCQLVAGWVTPH